MDPQLIAAAPDLLEACEAMTGIWGTHTFGVARQMLVRVAMEKALWAIAKSGSRKHVVLLPNGQPVSRANLKAKIQARISPEPMSGCWLWTGSCDIKGYGMLFVGRWNGIKRSEFAHRVSYLVFRDEMLPAKGLVLDHLCKVHCCVNPDHLELVTPAENTRRGNRKRGTHCLHGHEWTEENTWIHPTRPVVKHCRTCNLLKVRRYDAAKRAARSLAS